MKIQTAARTAFVSFLVIPVFFATRVAAQALDGAFREAQGLVHGARVSDASYIPEDTGHRPADWDDPFADAVDSLKKSATVHASWDGKLAHDLGLTDNGGAWDYAGVNGDRWNDPPPTREFLLGGNGMIVLISDPGRLYVADRRGQLRAAYDFADRKFIGWVPVDRAKAAFEAEKDWWINWTRRIISPTGGRASIVGEACEILSGVRGTCFFNSDRSLLYWIVRRYYAGGIGGPEFIGYAKIEREQERYNSEVSIVRANRSEAIARSKSDPYAGMTLSGVGPYGWNDDFSQATIPEKFPLLSGGDDMGVLSSESLSVPNYLAETRIVSLWARLQASYPAVGSIAQSLKIDPSRTCPATTLCRLRAERLIKAARNTAAIDAEIQSAWKAGRNPMRPEDLPAGLLEKVRELTEAVSSDLNFAEEAEKADQSEASGR